MKPPSQPWVQAAALAGLGLLLRVAWMAYASPVPVSDYAAYRAFAEELLRFHQLGVPHPTAYRLPAYPLFLAACMLVSTSIVWLRLANVLLSASLVGLVYGIGYRTTNGDRRAATFAALACALDPNFVFFSPVLASEHLFTALLFAALFLLVRARGPSLVSASLAGVLLRVAVLTRGEGIFQIPTCVLALGLASASWRRKAAALALLALPVALLVGAWSVRNGARVGPGAGVSTSGGVNFYMAHNGRSYGYLPLEGTRFERLSEIEAQKLGYRLGLEYLKQNPFRLARDAAVGTEELFRAEGWAARISVRLPKTDPARPYPEKPLPGRRLFAALEVLGYAAILLLAALSLVFLPGFPPRAWVLPVAVIAMNWLCYAVVYWANARYRFAAEAALCLLAGLTLSRIWGALGRRAARKDAAPGLNPSLAPRTAASARRP